MKEKDPIVLELREQLVDVYNNLYYLEEKGSEKYADEINRLKEIAKEIKHKMALRKTKIASEEVAKEGRGK